MSLIDKNLNKKKIRKITYSLKKKIKKIFLIQMKKIKTLDLY